MSDKLSELAVYAFFLIPVIIGLYSASKGVRKDDAYLLCAYCKQPIAATARACPYCRRKATFDVFSRKGKKMMDNTKYMRFWKGIIYGFVAEIALGTAVGVLLLKLGVIS